MPVLVQLLFQEYFCTNIDPMYSTPFIFVKQRQINEISKIQN